MPHLMTPEEAAKEKNAAAFASVLTAILLTGMKLVIGITTNSLGILSEAAHSGFDLLAALVTLFAVRYAASPADPGHPYGHGKIENLSALVEALLLLITCGWIIWEAIDRLFFTPAIVKPSLWALGVMLTSIILDVFRSRALKRIAKKHKSQALEADALHFSTDIWSSAVVVLGICALYIAAWLPESSVFKPWLEQADSIAALGVAIIVIMVSVSLARRAVNILLDAGDASLAASITKAVLEQPGIHSVHRLRLRHSGPTVFVDMSLVTASSLVLDEVDQLRQEVEKRIYAIDPGADIILEILPQTPDSIDTIAGVRILAASWGLEAHAIESLTLEGESAQSRKHVIQLHIERDPEETLATAHEIVSQFEGRLQQEFPGAVTITHIEPRGVHTGKGGLIQGQTSLHIQQVIHETLLMEPGVHNCHNILLSTYDSGQRASFHCCMAPETSVTTAHEAATRIQASLHKQLPELIQITVHMEPLRVTLG